jgi:hypothetical protein
MEERLLDKVNVINKEEMIEALASALHEYATNQRDSTEYDMYLTGILLGCLICMGLEKEVMDNSSQEIAMQLLKEYNDELESLK